MSRRRYSATSIVSRTKGAILASNTSYLDIDAIGAVTQRPASVLGTHFFSPANVMRLLEIVRGKNTAPDVVAAAVALGRKLGKVPVVVGNRHGFVGNRMLGARSIEAERLLLEGALPHEVDGALVEFGFPDGAVRHGRSCRPRCRLAQSQVARLARGDRRRAVRGRALWAKDRKGFYRYEAGARTPLPDTDVESLIVAASRRLGLARRPIDKKEIVERLIFPMINEGARILEEGIAQRPGDIDVIWVYGYGFPVWRGGPMFYADSVGLAYIRDRLAALAKHSDDKRHEPAALLARLAAAGPRLRFARKIRRMTARPCIWEKSYPPGIRWDTPIVTTTLPALIERSAASFPDRPAIEFRDRQLLYKELAAASQRLTAGLLRLGIGRGTAVGFYLPNTPDHPIALFGVARTGARVVQLSPLDAERELIHKLKDSGARIVLTINLPGLLPMAREAQGGRSHRSADCGR